jgi:ABC-type enterochelin transport system, periplasmic component
MSKLLQSLRAGLAVASLAVGLAVAPLAAGAAEISVPHAQGVTVLEKTPEAVLVFDLAALDTLDTLGVPVKGVPQGVKPDYLKKYDDDAYLKIGSLFEPDLETVAAAAPDLIVVGGRSAAKYADLAAIAPTVDMTSDFRAYLDSAEERIRALAAIFGKEGEAERRLDALRASIAAVREKAADAGTALVVLTTGGRMSAYGPGSRFGVIHTDFGFKPAAPDLDVATHGQAISYEFIRETDPDFLFVVDRDAAVGQHGQAAAAMLDNDIIRQTKAAKSGRIVYLKPDNWYLSGTGLSALQLTVDEIAAALR